MTADPIASATLARLYIEQDHLGRARSVVDAVLRRDPLDGHALALRDRLRAYSHARVDCRVEGDELRVTWRRLAGARLATVRIAICTGRATERRYVDVPCKRPNGSHRMALPEYPASAVACILGPGKGTTRTPVAVSSPIAW